MTKLSKQSLPHKKRRPVEVAFLKNTKSLGDVLLDSLFRKLGAFGAALASLELGVGFIDHIEGAFTFHNLTTCVAALH